MGFQDTFTRDDGSKSNLQYDDTAFYYFFIGVLVSIVVPMSIGLLKPLFFNPVKEKLKNTCKCDFCKAKVQKLYKQNKNKFFNNGYKIKIIVILILVIFIKKTYQAIDNEKQTMKRFDPYEILEIPSGSERQVIKKAYRNLSRKYHPDKAKDDPQATSKFIMVTKAYECLTDEKKKHLCEKYGNPDGPGKLSIAIAMPSFLLKKENHVSVLFIFFFFLLIVLPAGGFYWYKQIGLKNEQGVLQSNRKGFYQRLNEALILKNCPELIALCDEYAHCPVNKQQVEDLARLLKGLDPDFNLKKLPEAERQRFATPYVIICAHLQGLNIPKSLEKLHYDILTTAPQLVQAMIAFIMHLPFFHRKIPAEQRGNLKFFGIDPILRLIEFQQSLVQGLWLGSEKYPDLLQLSYFKENPSERRNKKLPKLLDLIKTPRDQRKLNFLIDENDKDRVNDELDMLPNVDVDIFCGVEGEDTICDIDQVSIKTTITRNQLKDKQENKLVHSVNFPSFRNENWHVIIASERKEVIDYQLLTGSGKTLSTKFQTRFPPGKFKLILYVKSDSYRGYDIEKELNIVVKSQHEVNREVEWHEEDKDLDQDLSLFGQMMQQLNPQQNDSDDEEEEEDDDKKKEQKSQDAEEEEEEEEEEEN